MKIFYDHVISKQADTDFNYTLISAWVDSGEEDEALTTGWLPTYFYTDEKYDQYLKEGYPFG